MSSSDQALSGVRKVSCHCQAVELRVDFTVQAASPMRCNCSLCRRKGAVMIGVPLAAVDIVRGRENLTLYQWNTHVAEHYFCNRCGIYTHHRRRRDPSQYGINAGCIEGVDPGKFDDVQRVDGASLSVVEADGA
jgi:hypothetical protein